jgi:hypothetical protein
MGLRETAYSTMEVVNISTRPILLLLGLKDKLVRGFSMQSEVRLEDF